MKVLILTVGGSPDQLIASINKNKPDFVYFISTEKTGTKVGSKKIIEGTEGRTVPQMAELSDDKWKNVTIDFADDPDKIFDLGLKLIREIKKKFDNPEIIVDYSGGTKSMSVGLALAGIEGGAHLKIIDGIRNDLNKIVSGSEYVKEVKLSSYLYNKIISIVEELWEKGFYLSAASVIESYLDKVPDKYVEEARLIYYLSLGFGKWDRFQYEEAYKFFKLMKKSFSFISSYLNIVRQLKEGVKEGDYLVVMDILENAERRTRQKLFDDAIGRIYRATELVAQVRLKKEWGIDTSNVLLEKIPSNLHEELKNYYEDKKGRIKLPLMPSYNLLSKLEDEIFKKWFKENEKELKNFLELRNYSFYAHGLQPLDEESFSKAKEYLSRLKELVYSLDSDLKNYPKFPTDLKSFNLI